MSDDRICTFILQYFIEDIETDTDTEIFKINE